jgi:threonine dehydratase
LVVDSGVAVVTHRLSLEAIERATRTIDPVFTSSPQYECEPLSAALGVRTTLKVETLNPIRSFKGRGADFFVRENAAALAGIDLVCATAGNFGQAMAYACRALGRSLVIYSATNANPLKIERMSAMGAEVRQVGNNFDAAKEAAKEFCASSGARFVEDGLDVAISEGAGTIAVELLAARRWDQVVIPVGNGALIAGMARWIKHHAPDVRVVGVSSSAADAMHASWHAQRVIERDSVSTIADGIAVRTPVPEALDDMRSIVDDMVLVDDDALVASMRLMASTAGLIVEPAGVAGVAALLEHADLRTHASATVVCGSNLTVEQIRKWLIDN